jgi:hypothetical protein
MTMVVCGAYKRDTKVVPSEPHWAIVRFESISTSDGYGGSSLDTIARYYVYEAEIDWKNAIQDLYRQKVERKWGVEPEFYAFHVDSVAKVKTTVVIE